MSQGDPAVRPAAIRAMGRLVYRTQIDLSRLHQSLLQHLYNILATSSIAEFSKAMICAVASTMSLIILKNPSLGGHYQVFDILVNILSSSLSIDNTLLVFRALQAIISVHQTLAMITLLPTAILRSYRRIIHNSDNLSHDFPITKEITQIMLSIIFTDTISSSQIEEIAIEPRLLEDLHYTLACNSNLSKEMIFQTLTRRVKSSGHVAKRCQLATINSLPPEIIAQTMAICLPQGRDWDLAGAEHMPHTLGQINGVWRQVALHTPSIWADLNIELSSGGHEGRSGAITTVINMWLIRSGGLPINITIKCILSGPSLGLHRHIDQLAFAILPFSRFWRDIHLQLPFSSLKNFHQAHQKYCNMPRLRSFSLIGAGFALCLHEPPLSLEFAPSLRVLELYNVGLDFNALWVMWSQLTELRLRVVGWTTQQWVDMLSSCSQVKYLCLINKCIERAQELYTGPPISLPCLEVLHVNHGFNHLVLSIITPRLRELYMEHSGFSMRLIWASGGLSKFILALARFKEATAPLRYAVCDLVYDGQDRNFLFTVLNPDITAPENYDEMLSDLAMIIQCLGKMEFDLSSCPDQALVDLVVYLLCTISPASTGDIIVTAGWRVEDALMRELENICDENENVKLVSDGTGLKVHISRWQVKDSKE